ncbi:MAG: protoporphyrinogen oxidase HemJ [Gammaproteobacteria bacterium]|nr:MAG: protoporphyrinogen oxidase HemJ [Gammaproteobacteria bacterium]
MSWIKAFHIIAMVAWFAGLFYLPRLFVYHADAKDQISIERFKIMEHRLYYYIMLPSAILTLLFGFILFSFSAHYYAQATWMHLKLGLVAVLILFHLYCGKCLADFKFDKNQHTSLFYRWLNELPTLLLIAIVIVAEVQPF